MQKKIESALRVLSLHFGSYHAESIKGAWQTLKTAVLAQQSTNSDYTEALKAELTRSRLSDHIDLEDADIHELAVRLNSAIKASQNCA
jgi:hypothetical protein